MIEIIDHIVDEGVLERTVERFRERGIILPTFAQQANPELVPDAIRDRLRNVGLWDLDPVNLFRITWKNEPVPHGGLFGGVNHVELPPELTGVPARIVVLIGKWFPTGAHKVGAAYGCLAPRLITGAFDPTYHKAVWPSTGNYCRGGAFDSWLMGCTAVAILPEEMSRERFEWLESVGAEVIRTPGCESNVKEIYDKCWEIRKTRPDAVIFNQFDEFGNAVWHHRITGPAIEEVFEGLPGSPRNLAAFVSATGSAGTIAAGDYLKTVHPTMKIVASEALQCPTLLLNGFGGHRIEGIGDKHVPWIHHTNTTDMVVAIDDEATYRLMRLFNEPEGTAWLERNGVPGEIARNLDLFGISSIANVLSAIKAARYWELTSDDVVVTVATDSMELYGSRIDELRAAEGPYTESDAARDFDRWLLGATTDNLQELTYRDRRRIHNLKYYTWIEQQGKAIEDLERLWYDRDLWPAIFAQPDRWDALIEAFNERVGLL